MLASDILQISLRQLSRNRRRYRGVIIGIALGIAGLVTVLTMGDSVETDLSNNLEILGSATILKATWDYDRSQRWHHGQYYDKDIESLGRLPGVRSVSPVVWKINVKISRNNAKMVGRLMGAEPNFFATIYLPIVKGRSLTEEDLRDRASVCIVGQHILKNLLKDDSDPIGKEIFVSGHSLRIVGEIGGVEDKGFLETIIVPLTMARSRFPSMYEIKDIYVALQAGMWLHLCKDHGGGLDRQPACVC